MVGGVFVCNGTATAPQQARQIWLRPGNMATAEEARRRSWLDCHSKQYWPEQVVLYQPWSSVGSPVSQGQLIPERPQCTRVSASSNNGHSFQLDKNTNGLGARDFAVSCAVIWISLPTDFQVLPGTATTFAKCLRLVILPSLVHPRTNFVQYKCLHYFHPHQCDSCHQFSVISTLQFFSSTPVLWCIGGILSLATSLYFVRYCINITIKTLSSCQLQTYDGKLFFKINQLLVLLNVHLS